jgi:outer membrane biosynthesis protein TonB
MTERVRKEIRMMWCRGAGFAFFLGLSVVRLGAETNPPKRVALRIESSPGDLLARSQLDRLETAVQRGLKGDGIEVVPFGNRPSDSLVLRLFASASQNRKIEGADIRLTGVLVPPSSSSGTAPADEPRSATLWMAFRGKDRFSDLLEQSAQQVVRWLFDRDLPSKAGTRNPLWVEGSSLAGAVPAEGNRMKADGALPPLDYPWEARVVRAKGHVTVKMVVDAKGRVLEAVVKEGPSNLGDSALDYASGLRFVVPEDLKPKAPLRFNLSINYRLPDVSKVSRALLEVQPGPFKEPGLQPDPKSLEGLIRDALVEEGVQVSAAGEARDETLHHLRVEVETLRERGDLCLFGVRARLSRDRDRDLARSEPGKPPALVFEGLVAGQRGEKGFKERLAQSVKDVIRSITDSPKPLDPEGLGETSRGSVSEPAEFDFSAIKIKHQPPAPRYPEAARQLRIQGVVVVVIDIDEEGRPVRGIVHKGPSELQIGRASCRERVS